MLRFPSHMQEHETPINSSLADSAREVLRYAGEHARRYRQEKIGTEHLVLGLTYEPDKVKTVIQDLRTKGEIA